MCIRMGMGERVGEWMGEWMGGCTDLRRLAQTWDESFFFYGTFAESA